MAGYTIVRSRRDQGREPLYKSLMQTDFYQFTVMMIAFLHHRYVKASYRLINRSKSVLLGNDIPLERIRAEFDHLRTLRFKMGEVWYLSGMDAYGKRMFGDAFLEFLKNFHLPEYELEKRADGQIVARFSANWCESGFWETFALGVINALRIEELLKGESDRKIEEIEARALVRLADKARRIKQFPGLTVSDFGTRRAASPMWHRRVDEVLFEILGPTQFRGTSNVRNALELDVMPIGTSSHQGPMSYSAIYWDGTHDGLVNAHRKWCNHWYEQYGSALAIDLPDTFGSAFYYDYVVDESHLQMWKGARQDSGVPDVFADAQIDRYRRLGIDPKSKLLVFSDGLDVALDGGGHENDVVRLYKKYGDRIGVTFGVGTMFTNDIPDIKPVSIVVKPVGVAGRRVAKLSDNIEKATGDADVVTEYRRLAHYDMSRASHDIPIV